jgi:hypothetical protein
VGALSTEFDSHYGLLPPEQTVLVRAYSDDTDDRVLAEIRPKFIVMFEPNMEFIRRIEVRITISFIELASIHIANRCINHPTQACRSGSITWYMETHVKSINTLPVSGRKRNHLRDSSKSEA